MNAAALGPPVAFPNLLLDSVRNECLSLSDFLLSLHVTVTKTGDLAGRTTAYLIPKRKKKKVNIPQKDRAPSVGIKRKVRLEP